MAFPTVTVLDDFDRANEGPPPSASWTDITNGLKVVSNEAAGDASGGNHSYWTVAPTSGDQDVYTWGGITLPGDGEQISVGLRITPMGVDGYALRFTQDDAAVDTLKIVRVDSGVDTVLKTFNKEISDGDYFGLQAVGAGLTAFYWNGVTSAWERLGTAQDNTYSSGNVSLAITNTTGRVAAFGAGNHASAGTIRTDIFDIVNGVWVEDADGVVQYTGRVHHYKRYAKLYDDFLNLFKVRVDGREAIRGFEVEAGPVTPERLTFRDIGDYGINDKHEFRIHGYLSWDDERESELTAELLARAVKTALDDSDILHDGSNYYNADPAIITNLEPRMFGSVLVNYIQIQQNVYIQVT